MLKSIKIQFYYANIESVGACAPQGIIQLLAVSVLNGISIKLFF